MEIGDRAVEGSPIIHLTHPQQDMLKTIMKCLTKAAATIWPSGIGSTG
jgi:hypothetical protein